MERNRTLEIAIEGAIIAAMAMALNYLPHSVGISSIQFEYGIIPLSIYSLRRGVVPGLLAGLTWGILDMILRGIGDGSVLNPLQGFMEYPLAFSVLGLTGLGSVLLKKKLKNGDPFIFTAVVFSALGTSLKYFIHFIAGGYFWGMFAPKSMNPWIYSLIINGGSIIANILLTIIVIYLLKNSIKKILIA